VRKHNYLGYMKNNPAKFHPNPSSNGGVNEAITLNSDVLMLPTVT